MSRFGKRIFRDVTAVVIFCGVFFGAVVLINFFQTGTEKKEIADFSEQRISADLAIERKDYDSAAESFNAILNRDPYNGRAIFMLARIRFRVFQRIENQIYELQSDGSSPSADTTSQIDALKKDRQASVDLGISEFEKAAAHARFLEDSCYYLSVLHTANNEFDIAVEYLTKFVNAGRFHQRGLGNLDAFKPLHSHPKFAKITERENETRSIQIRTLASESQFIMPSHPMSRNMARPEKNSQLQLTKKTQTESSHASATENKRSLIASYRSWFGYNMIRLGRELVNFVGEFLK